MVVWSWVLEYSSCSARFAVNGSAPACGRWRCLPADSRIGRLTGLLVEGTINNFMLAFLVIEIVVTLLAVFVLRQAGN